MIAVLQNGGRFFAGIEHQKHLIESIEVVGDIRSSLIADFDVVSIN
jgi:hypothetical protein